MTNTTAARTYNHYSRSKTVTVEKVKAKHSANQPGLDRLQELLVKATANPSGGQNFAQTIKRALRSLQECKHPILTQQDAVKLKYVGPAMAKKICPQSTMKTATATREGAGGGASSSSALATTKKNVSKRKRIGRSGSHQRDGTEMENGNNMHCSDTQQLASTTTRHRLHTNEWCSGQRPLVCSTYSIPSTLSPSFDSAVGSSKASLKSTSKEAAYRAAKQEAEALALGLPTRGPWKVILLVDNREHKSKQVVSSCKQAGIPCEERQLAIGDMAWIARCCRFEEASTDQRAQAKKSKRNEGNTGVIEVMLGTIVERKEVADLASSLFGTRYAEQRLRLSECGLPQVLFLVEGDLASVSNCPSDTLQMAMMETRLQLGFSMIRTQNLADTVCNLKTLHSRIVQRTFPEAYGRNQEQRQVLPAFGGGNRRRNRPDRRASSLLELVFDTPPAPPFGEARFITYPELKAKVELDRERGTRSIRALSLAMLKQIPSLSQKKCTAIANRFPTFNGLLKGLSYPGSNSPLPKQIAGGTVRAAVTKTTATRKPSPLAKHPKQIVKDIEIESGRGRTIGPISASEVYAACCTLGDGSTVYYHSQQQPTDIATTSAAAASMVHHSQASEKLGARKPPPSGTASELMAHGFTLPITTLDRSTADLAGMPSTSPKATLRTNASRNQLDSPPSFSPFVGVDISSDAELGTNDSTVQSGSPKNPMDFDADSPSPRGRHKKQEETVDLLTPEVPRLGTKSFTTKIPSLRGAMDPSAWPGNDSDSDISNDEDDRNNPASKAVTLTATRTTKPSNGATSSGFASAASTSRFAIAKPKASQRQQPETVLLLSSSSEDEDGIDGNLLRQDAVRKRPGSTSVATRHEAKKRASSSSDLTKNSEAMAVKTPRPLASGQVRNNDSPASPAPSSDTSTLFTSPEASAGSLGTPSDALAQKPQSKDEQLGGRTDATKALNKHLPASENGGREENPVPEVVSLLDNGGDESDSDSDRNDCTNGFASVGGKTTGLFANQSGPREHPGSRLPGDNFQIGAGSAPAPGAAIAANSLLLASNKMPPPNVTTKRGGRSLHSSPLSAASSSSSAASSAHGPGDKDLDVGSSLRERLEAKIRHGTTAAFLRGTSVPREQEVIEIDDSDDGDDDDGD